MITIEQTLSILKQDNNFRTIALNDELFYNWHGETFQNISYNSKTADFQTLFFVKGLSFKEEFLKEAVQQGLRFYVAERDYHVGIPVIIVNDIKQAMSLIAMAFYGYPQNKLKLLAFTGTKGKTTAAYYAYTILKQGHKPAMLSTMNTTLDGKTFFKSTLTTPESLDLFEMMATAVDNGMTHLIMEVSSQAYLTKRVYGLTFDVGIFLNISPDHIGPIEHPTFEDYFYHKRLLLDNSRTVIINSQMAYFDLLKEQVADADHIFYGPQSENQIINPKAFSFDVIGQLDGHYDSQLLGSFNQENALAAGLACLKLGVTKEDIKKGIAKTSVPGRMEVISQKNGAKVFVDYAHNGDSVNKLIQVVLGVQTGQVFLILGATGNKGESRRADFGKLLNHYPDLTVILTADDPNYEDPAKIAQEIASYMDKEPIIITDREEAIKTAMAQTKNNTDAVIIAGKGADAYQIVNGERQSYPGDLEVAKKYL